jgi:hypothetical protein
VTPWATPVTATPSAVTSTVATAGLVDTNAGRAAAGVIAAAARRRPLTGTTSQSGAVESS